MQTTVKKWFRDKNYGFLDNGDGPDIMVRKADLQNCQYLRVGVAVEFEVGAEKSGLIAKKVKLSGSRNNQDGQNQNNHNNHQNNGNNHNNRHNNSNGQRNNNNRPFRPGVMT
ncbi:MAG: cold shock domain-containing protein [Pseudomonadales bacterium]|nr:cold shock domain-containing protein [Pseudomonadales bacterium]